MSNLRCSLFTKEFSRTFCAIFDPHNYARNCTTHQRRPTTTTSTISATYHTTDTAAKLPAVAHRCRRFKPSRVQQLSMKLRNVHEKIVFSALILFQLQFFWAERGGRGGGVVQKLRTFLANENVRNAWNFSVFFICFPSFGASQNQLMASTGYEMPELRSTPPHIPAI